MNKDQVVARLRANEAELKSAGILRLLVFGSVVRGEARPGSDVDLAANFDRAKVRGILDEVGLRNRLAETLSANVDLCDADKLERQVESNFRREAEIVF